MSVLVIIPAYNEAKNIESVIHELKCEFGMADILVVNDCSADETDKVVRDLGVNCITHPFNMGYSAALQTGFKYAKMQGYDYVIQFDGDGQHIAKEAKKLFDILLETDCDIIIGSRYFCNNGYESTFFRSLGTRFFYYLILLLCRKRIYDPTSGLQVLKRKVYEKYSVIHGYPDYPDANLLIENFKAGLRIVEIPVKMRTRTSGVSMHNGIFKPIKYMILMLYSIMIVMFKRLDKVEAYN